MGRKSHLKKGVLEKFAIYIGKYMRWNLLNKVTGLQPVNLSRKETPVQIFSCKFCKSFYEYFFKYTSGRLLLQEHWISRKWWQYLFALMFLALVIKRSLYFSLFPDCLRLISLNFCRKFYQSFSGTLGFFCLLKFD